MRFVVRILAAVLVAAGLACGSALTASAAPASHGVNNAGQAKASATALKTVHYLGYRFDIPRSWPVVNLAQHPTDCVLMDRHALYLGRPGANEQCPASGAGMATEAVVVQPGPARVAERSVLNPIEQQVTVTAPRIQLLASYNTNRSLILRILAGASLPAPVTSIPKPRAASRRAMTPAAAIPGPSSTSYQGLGFDTCAAPSSGTMSAWLSSPYRAVGIYIGGSARSCVQSNLTASWVSTQYTAGWRFILFYPGPQALCGQLENPPTSQASNVASDAVAQAENLGFGSGATIYYDMDSSGCSGTSNTESVIVQFLADWTNDLHALGYKSGVYGSADGYLQDLVNNYTSSTMPDFIHIADYNGECSTTSDPYIPANEWANHQRIHQCAGNLNQTYGGVEIGIDEDYLDVLVHGATSATAGVPRAAVYDQDTRNFEVYATGTDGTLQETFWSGTSGGWSAWKDLGGSITGSPCAAYDQDTGNFEVYATGTDGTLQETFWSGASGGWSAWRDLGGSITGSPSCGYDKTTGNFEVFATGTNGSLEEIFWSGTSGGWSAWRSLGGSIENSPSAVYDQDTNNFEVYATGTGGSLEEIFWSGTSGGWSAWRSLGGSITGSPDPLYDKATGNFEVYATGTGGTLEETFWSGTSGGWSAWRSLGGSIKNSPSAAYDQDTNNFEIYATGTGGNLEEIFWNGSGGGWSAWRNGGGSITGSPDPGYDQDTGNFEVYALGSGNTLEETFWSGTSGGWSAWKNLGGAIGQI